MHVDAGEYQKNAARIYLAETAGEDPYSLEEFSRNRECVPEYLYKYHAVDDYTLDALEKGYLYIAPADRMDDQFELALNMIEGISDIEGLHRFDTIYVRYLLDTLESSSPVFAEVIGRMREELGEEPSAEEISAYAAEMTKADPVFPSVAEKLAALSGSGGIREYTEGFLQEMLALKEKFGLYSMTEDRYNQVMWCMYGSDYRGILIEYDLSAAEDTLIRKLIKVRYSDHRDADPLKLFTDKLVSVLVRSEEQKQYQLRLLEWVLNVLATKNTEWAFQKEWRVISRPAEKVSSPRVSAIYMGKHISDEDRERVCAVAAVRGIDLYVQEDDFEHMQIRYRRI